MKPRHATALALIIAFVVGCTRHPPSSQSCHIIERRGDPVLAPAGSGYGDLTAFITALASASKLAPRYASGTALVSNAGGSSL